MSAYFSTRIVKEGKSSSTNKLNNSKLVEYYYQTNLGIVEISGELSKNHSLTI